MGLVTTNIVLALLSTWHGVTILTISNDLKTFLSMKFKTDVKNKPRIMSPYVPIA